MTPNIAAKHPAYEAFARLWKKISDCVAGEDTIKAAGDSYLPRPNPEIVSDENKERYKSYIARACFVNFTGQTVEKMQGQCFALSPVFTGPAELEPILANIDGAGVTAEQQAKKALGLILMNSRAGLLTDYPETGGVISKAEKESKNLRAKIVLYTPENIINWRISQIGAKAALSLVVLEERYISKDDGFEAEFSAQWRVLIIQDGIYKVQIWRKGDSGYVMASEVIPQDGRGEPFKEIPFQFIGAESNDSTLEKPLMIDIANVNLAHYRNSADYEESVYMVGQPTPWLSGLTQDWVEKQMKGAIMLGSRSAILLPENSAAGLLQADANTLPKEAMDQKEKQIVALGGRLIEKKEVAATATEATLNEASETSILAGCCNNVSAAYKQALEWASMFDDITFETDGILYELNTDFAVSRMTPEEAGSVQKLYDGQLIAYEEARDKLKKGGIAYLDDIEAKDQIDKQAEDDLLAAKKAMEATGGAKPPGTPAKPGKAAPDAKLPPSE